MLISKLFALVGLGAIAPALAAPAPAPSDAAATIATSKAADGEYCTDTISRYSTDGYTWASFRFCIRVSNAGTEFIGKVDKAEYLWGSAWYNTKGAYPYKWSFHANNRDPGWAGSPGGEDSAWDHGEASSPATFDVGQISDTITPGAHEYLFTYTQTGPYWKSVLNYNNVHTIVIPAAT